MLTQDAEVAAQVSELDMAKRWLESEISYFEEILFQRRSFFAREETEKINALMVFQGKVYG